ncbi:hypothetical protein BaRGS_00033462 [Batillaria attramentaria]|uniref:Uncharacterized protein n=1 Tax=Batillaria attramentaria TaxID=370345 RepID=A0ABD0JKU9_9CAEN
MGLSPEDKVITNIDCHSDYGLVHVYHLQQISTRPNLHWPLWTQREPPGRFVCFGLTGTLGLDRVSTVRTMASEWTEYMTPMTLEFIAQGSDRRPPLTLVTTQECTRLRN